ncbi:hypothetical protein GMD78_10025 [Ornithinibacillus sp. L9]|uniref:Uncharacterized protein n=1 Tax=Ornithinibacillus caprae TaxID=2678566 RepID=A0A6N8FN01_9BACI|nr:hypothetical protein [Ornithinibacillus caprae]MUK88728.1 hypothetical protein [Ornithinibacillus caprae]
MAKEFIAYFKTEDDLLSAHASLKTLHTHELRVDKIPNEGGGYTVFPFTATSSEAAMNFGYGAFYSSASSKQELDGEIHVLEGKVDEPDYDAVVHVLRENNGYQRSEDIQG